MEQIGRFYPISRPANAPDLYGRNAPIVKTFRVNLDAALENERYQFGGSSLWAVDASDISARCSIKIGDQQRDGVPFLRGTFLSGVPFSEVYINCDAQAGKWITFVVTTAENILVANPDQAFSEVQVTKPSGFATVADVTLVAGAAAAQILAADSTRVKALICSLQANTQTIRVGDSNTGAARGAEIAPGESMEIEGTGALYAYTGAGTDQVLSITYSVD